MTRWSIAIGRPSRGLTDKDMPGKLGRRMSAGGNRRPFPLRALVLAFALIDGAPTQLGEVKRVTVRVLESYERTGLSFVYDPLELHALAFQRAHGIVDGAAQL